MFLVSYLNGFYANKCLVNLIDFKTLTIFAQKTVENKKTDEFESGQKEPSAVNKTYDNAIKYLLIRLVIDTTN